MALAEPAPDVWAPDVSALFVLPLLAQMREEVGQQAVDGFLQSAGVELEHFHDDGAWVSLRFLEGTAEALVALTGDEQSVTRSARRTLSPSSIGVFYPLLRLLGSPRMFYERLPGLAANWNRVNGVAVESTGPRSATIRYTACSEKRERSVLVCHARREQIAAAPTIWGLPEARVVQTECMHEGGEACTYEVTWTRRVRSGAALLGASLGLGCGLVLALGGLPTALLGALGVAAGLAVDSRRALREARSFAEEQNQALERMLATAHQRFADLMTENRLRSQAENEQARLRGQLQVSERMASMGLIAAGVAHEINNPLSYVTANLELVEEDLRRFKVEGVPTPAALEPLIQDTHHALQGTREIARIVREIKQFAREPGTDIESVSLRSTIDSALTLASSQLRGRAELELDIGELPCVRAIPGRLGQVFLNLLVNAAQALPESSVQDNRITVRAWSEEHTVVCEVGDNGPGIPAVALERVYEPFFTTKPPGQGTGLGLYLCRQIVVDELGGELRIESQPGHGARVQVRLPADQPSS